MGIGRISVDGQPDRPGGRSPPLVPATTRSTAPRKSRRQAPVSFRRGEVVTFHVAGHRLAPGEHRFEVEIVERDAGLLLTLSLKDTVSPRPEESTPTARLAALPAVDTASRSASVAATIWSC